MGKKKSTFDAVDETEETETEDEQEDVIDSAVMPYAAGPAGPNGKDGKGLPDGIKFEIYNGYPALTVLSLKAGKLESRYLNVFTEHGMQLHVHTVNTETGEEFTSAAAAVTRETDGVETF